MKKHRKIQKIIENEEHQENHRKLKIIEHEEHQENLRQ